MKKWKKPLLVVLVTLLSIALYGSIVALGIKAVTHKPNPPTPQELLTLVNAERARVGIKPLVINENVQRAAQLKANDMYTRDYFEHTIKDTQYTLSPEMIKLTSKSCHIVSENIFWGKTDNTSRGALYSWMSSRLHREAILNPNYTLTGFGVAGNKVAQHLCISL